VFIWLDASWGYRGGLWLGRRRTTPIVWLSAHYVCLHSHGVYWMRLFSGPVQGRPILPLTSAHWPACISTLCGSTLQLNPRSGQMTIPLGELHAHPHSPASKKKIPIRRRSLCLRTQDRLSQNQAGVKLVKVTRISSAQMVRSLYPGAYCVYCSLSPMNALRSPCAH
jgi:hypothetical protein